MAKRNPNTLPPLVTAACAAFFLGDIEVATAQVEAPNGCGCNAPANYHCGNAASGGSGGGSTAIPPGMPEWCNQYALPKTCSTRDLLAWSGLQPGEQDARLSDPIALSFSDFYQEHTDLFIPGIGLDFEFTRVYRSRSGIWSELYRVDTWLNPGFDYQGNELEELLNGDIIVTDGDRLEITRRQPLGMNWSHSYNIQAYPGARDVLFWTWQGLGQMGEGGAIRTNVTQSDYDQAVANHGRAEIVIVTPDGRVDRYQYKFNPFNFATWDPQGQGFDPPVDPVLVFENPQRHSVIHWDFNGFLLTDEIRFLDSDGTTYYFRNDINLVDEIVDRNGNTIDIVAELIPGTTDQHRIDYILDTRMETIDFVYHNETGAPNDGNNDWAHLLWKIVHQAGATASDHREVTFDYAMTSWGPSSPPANEADLYPDKAKLTSVTLPSISATGTLSGSGLSEHARFPTGRTWQYAYDAELTTGTAQELAYIFWAGQVTQVTNPNGEVITLNEWSAPDLSENESDYRITRQVHGGGEFNYAYTDRDGLTTASAGEYFVWVNDRRGNIVRLRYENAYSRRLIERVDYGTPAQHANQASFGSVDEATGAVTWLNNGPPTPEPGEVIEEFITNYENIDPAWHVNDTILPNGDTVTELFDFGATDPRHRGALLSRTVVSDPGTSPAINVTEYWGYQFHFPGSGGSGSCGCGSGGFSTGYEDGNGNLTFTQYDSAGNATAVFAGISAADALAAGLDVDSSPTGFNVGPMTTAALATESFTYNTRGQMLTHTHAERTVLTGSGVSVQTQVDQYEYYGSGAAAQNRDRLHRVIRDHGGLALTTTYEYDIYGNVSKVTEPSSDYTEFVYNQSGELVRTQSREAGTSTLYAQTDYFYDAAGNLVVERVLNLDETLAQATNAHLTTVHEYSSVNDLTRTSVEAGDFLGTISYDSYGRATAPTGTGWLVRDMVYDAARNLSQKRYGEAVNGNQASNIVDYVYDSRDLPIRVIRGSSDESPLVIETKYDDNRRVVATIVDPDGTDPRRTQREYDALNRVIAVTDPMGNQSRLVYDSKRNARFAVRVGSLGADTAPAVVPGPQPIQPLLALAETRYDALDRPILNSTAAFDYDVSTPFLADPMFWSVLEENAVYLPGLGLPTPPALDVPPGTAWQTTETLYNPDSSVFAVDRLAGPDAALGESATTTYLYDGVGRTRRIDLHGASVGGSTPSLISSTLYEYDSDSNVIEQVMTDVSDLDPMVSEAYRTTFQYDALDRMVGRSQIRNGSTAPADHNTEVYLYDSRGNQVFMSDARQNETTYVFDSASRPLETRRTMRAAGSGTGPVDPINPEIVETRTYDASSRLTSITDDNGNTTTYGYDGLNRLTTRTMPSTDPGGGGYVEVYHTAYDSVGNPFQRTDARDVVVTDTYDLNNRVTRRDVGTFRGPTSDPSDFIMGAKREIYEYDGLGRVLSATNDEINRTLPGDPSTEFYSPLVRVERSYDSRSNIRTETTNANGGPFNFPALSDRTVTTAYDIANNETQITYPGGRVVGRTYDHLNRVDRIIDDPTGAALRIAEFDYIGPHRDLRRLFGDDGTAGANPLTQTDYVYSGYDGDTAPASNRGFGHIESITVTNVSTTAIVDARAFEWDAAGNRTRHEDTRPGYLERRVRSFVYDSADRLITSDSDYPETGATSLPGYNDYTLDGVHNRTEVTVTGEDQAGAWLGMYTYEGDQAENNQISRIPTEDGLSEWLLSYDANGNLRVRADACIADFDGSGVIDVFDIHAFLLAWNNQLPESDFNGDGVIDIFDTTEFLGAHSPIDGRQCEVRTYHYDYRDQLTGVDISVGGSLESSTRNTYDAMKRRTVEATDHDGVGPFAIETRRFVYAGVMRWEIIEELDGIEDTADLLVTRACHGRRIDDDVSHRISDGSGGWDDYYSHRDDMNTLYATTDDTGSAVERYEYGDYGDVRFSDAAGASQSDTQVEATSLFTGRRPIAGRGTSFGSTVIDYRHRTAIPDVGRFCQRDPAGYFDSLNLQAFVISNPLSMTDPTGLFALVPERSKGECRDRIRFALQHDPVVRELMHKIHSRCGGKVPKIRCSTSRHCNGGGGGFFDPDDEDYIRICRASPHVTISLAHELQHMLDHCTGDSLQTSPGDTANCERLLKNEARAVWASGECCRGSPFLRRNNGGSIQCVQDRLWNDYFNRPRLKGACKFDEVFVTGQTRANVTAFINAGGKSGCGRDRRRRGADSCSPWASDPGNYDGIVPPSDPGGGLFDPHGDY